MSRRIYLEQKLELERRTGCRSSCHAMHAAAGTCVHRSPVPSPISAVLEDHSSWFDHGSFGAERRMIALQGMGQLRVASYTMLTTVAFLQGYELSGPTATIHTGIDELGRLANAMIGWSRACQGCPRGVSFLQGQTLYRSWVAFVLEQPEKKVDRATSNKCHSITSPGDSSDWARDNNMVWFAWHRGSSLLSIQRYQ